MATVKEQFGSLVFDDRVMKASLDAKVYASLKKTIDEGKALDLTVSNVDTRAHRALNKLRNLFGGEGK